MIIDSTNYGQFHIGTKAANLFLLREKGYLVPPLFCVNEESQIRREEIASYMEQHFPKTELFSVRSSASVEDGTEFSFAGQFETYLNVGKEEVFTYIEKALASSCGDRVTDYCRQSGCTPDDIRMSVIVQEMVPADYSGVLFTANPQGILNETVVVLGRGSGENVVEDKTDTTAYYYNQTDRIYYYEKSNDSPLFEPEQLEAIVQTAEEIRELFETECDMEFAVKDGRCYLLQVRPITTLHDAEDEIILDNSNIVESYPNITLPLTQSFIKEVYYKVFRSLLLRLTHEKKTVEERDEILRNMLDVVNGRVYYRISNWYDVILLLPFSGRIIPVWQEMMGVSNKAVSSETGRKAGFLTHLRVMFSFFGLLLTSPRKMEKLDAYFTEVLEYFKSLDIKHADNAQLIDYYRTLEKKVTDQWDITLVNDMYSFIFTGLLKSRLKKQKEADYEVLTKRYISHISDMESLKPIRELITLSQTAKSEGRIAELKELRTNADYERYMEAVDDLFRRAVAAYIDTYGDRNMEELKLESRTFRTDPILLIHRIVRYAKEDTQLTEDTQELKPLKGLAHFAAKKASLGIRNREKSRLNRSRLYGMMRQMMLRVGENLLQDGSIAEREDIFWLYFDEIETIAVKERGDIAQETKDWKREIVSRKQQYQMFEALPAYTRLVFAGKVTDRNPTNVCEMYFEKGENTFSGVACSTGIVEGEVLIVEKPTVQIDTKDKILVTKMTDPGWVFLMADAKGIVAEKGSLLSHTAIIARELKKPAVVGVKNITRLLKNGDYVRLDGDKGEISVIG